MRWCHTHTTQLRNSDRCEYPVGVQLTKADMKPIEARLERSPMLPEYDITIRPKPPNGG